MALNPITPNGPAAAERIDSLAQGVVANPSDLARQAIPGGSPADVAQSSESELTAPAVTQDTALADVRDVQAVVAGNPAAGPGDLAQYTSLSALQNASGGAGGLSLFSSNR